MRYILSIFTVTIACASLIAQENEIDVQAMTVRHQFIVFPPTVGVTLQPGKLADLSNSTLLPNNVRQLSGKIGERSAVTQSAVSVATRESSVSAYQELATAVEASLSFFGSGKFRVSKQEADKFRENTLYARLAVIDDVQALEQANWPEEWTISDKGDPAERTADFVRRYGSHYVSKLYFGRAISIKATLRENEKARQDELEAKLRAGFLSFSLEGDFATKAKNETKDFQFDLFIAITGGKSDRPELTLLRSFEELDKFVKDLQSGKFRFESAAVAGDFVSLSGLTGDEQVDRSLRGDVKFIDSRVNEALKSQLEDQESRLRALESTISAPQDHALISFGRNNPGGRSFQMLFTPNGELVMRRLNPMGLEEQQRVFMFTPQD